MAEELDIDSVKEVMLGMETYFRRNGRELQQPFKLSNDIHNDFEVVRYVRELADAGMIDQEQTRENSVGILPGSVTTKGNHFIALLRNEKSLTWDFLANNSRLHGVKMTVEVLYSKLCEEEEKGNPHP